jgi:hypothetical protein
MAIGPPVIERMDARMDAVEAALRAALPTRAVKRSFQRHYTDHRREDLRRGVVVLVSAGEGDYRGGLGGAAREGTQRMLLIGHLQVDEHAEPVATERAETALIEEIKAFVQASPVAGLELQLDSVQHSRQQEHPYGWVVAYLDAGPPAQTTY